MEKTEGSSAASSECKKSIDFGRVLALRMRPQSLKDLVGQDEIIKLLEGQLHSGRIPHFFLFGGPVGCGKTTLARIVSRRLHEIHSLLSRQNPNNTIRASTREINAADRNGVDDIRTIIQDMRFKPLGNSSQGAKIVILDEAHQLSPSAQNALITETEDVPDHVYYMFCTSNPAKIIPALRRRAFGVFPRGLESVDDLRSLIIRAANEAGLSDFHENDIDDLVAQLHCREITSPGVVLQIAERFFAGESTLQCINSVIMMSPSSQVLPDNPDGKAIDVIAVCRAVTDADWKSCAKQLLALGKSEVWGIRSSLRGYLKMVLLKSDGKKALNCAKAIRLLSASEEKDDDVAGFVASVGLACFQMGAN